MLRWGAEHLPHNNLKFPLCTKKADLSQNKRFELELNTAVTTGIFNLWAILNFGLYLLINIILKMDKNVPIPAYLTSKFSA